MKKVILAFLLIVVLLFQAACVQEDEATVISPYPTEGRETKMVYLYFELKRQLNFDKGKINFKNYSLMTINGIANSLWQA